MNKEQALEYFEDLHNLLGVCQDRSERRDFLASVRGDEQYQEAFKALRDVSRDKAMQQPIAVGPDYRGCYFNTVGELIKNLGGNINEATVIGHTSYGARIVGFLSPRGAEIIAPIREGNLSDLSEVGEFIDRQVLRIGMIAHSRFPFLMEKKPYSV